MEKACTTGDEKTSFDFNKLSNELSEQGKNVEVGSSIEILKLADEVIKEEKAKGQRLRRNIICLNITVFTIVALLVMTQDFLLYLITDAALALTVVYTVQETLLQLNAIVLTYSVLKIRRMIKATN